MSTLSLVRAMVVKEIRTTLRERQQVIALIVSLVAGGVGVAVPAWNVAGTAERMRANAAAARAQAATAAPAAVAGKAPPATAASNTGGAARGPANDLDALGIALLPAGPAVFRWLIIGAATFVGVMYSLTFVGNASVAAFAGEKENKTLELGLAAPMSDGALFLGKCAAAIVPGVTCGYLAVVLAVAVAVTMLGPEIALLPVSVPLHALVLSVPTILLPAMMLTAIGVAASARAETVKGAAQTMGAAFFALFFGVGFLPGLVVRHTPLGPPLLKLLQAWLTWPFAAQYAMVLVALAIPTTLLLAFARAMVRRDRLLL